MRFGHGVRLLMWVSLVLSIGLSAPDSAYAWTRTVVESASARVDVQKDARLYILLRLDVEVHAGWLHELELVDLGDGVELDRYRPPYFRSEEGEIYRPEAELGEDGRIRLSFPRRDAPRRGEYRVFIRYWTRADASVVEVDGEPRARVVWSVPTWETGLHDVSVEFRAPKGTRVPTELHESSPGIDLRVTEGPRRTLVKWRRIHLPRMTTWPMTLDAPPTSIAVPVTPAEPVASPEGFRPLSVPSERHIAWTVVLLALLALLKRRAVERRFGTGALLVRLPWPTAIAVTVLAAGAVQWLDPAAWVWSAPLIALGLHRPVTRAARTMRRVASPEDLLDVTQPVGAAVLLACTACLFALGQPTGALLLLPLFALGTRAHLPPSPRESRRILRSFVEALRMPADAPQLGLQWVAGDDVTAPRIQLHLGRKRVGLREVSFVVASDAIGWVRRRSVMLEIRTRAQSDAEDLMRRRVPGAPWLRDANGHVVRLVRWDEGTVGLLRVLAKSTPKPTVKASRGTWLLRKMSEPRQRAA